MTAVATGTGQTTVPAAVPVRWSVRFLLVWLAILAVLEIVVRAGVPTGLFLPAPSAVAMSLAEMIRNGSLVAHLVVTMSRIAMGLLVGVGIGVTLGLAMGASRRLRRLLDPVVAAIHPIPRLAFFPLLIVVFGVGEM